MPPERRFFAKAIKATGNEPAEVVTDKASTYPAVLGEPRPGAFHNTEKTCQQRRRERPRATQGPATSRVRIQEGPVRRIIIAGDGPPWRYAPLEAENAELRAVISELRSKVADLEAKLGQTAKDSSVPPSSDPNSARAEAKADGAARRGGSRKQGKQLGVQGRHLAQVLNPDQRVVHRPKLCADCGADLAGARVVGSEKRQVFDLPPIKVEVTEHVSERVACLCGHVTTGKFPVEATAPACWGRALKPWACT